MPPYNGSGGTSQPANSIYPATGSTLIESAKANASFADLYTMAATAICKDGQTTITANIPMATYKLTGLGAGTAAGHSVRYEQVFTSQALTDAATISWAATAPVATVTLGGNRTMAAPSGLVAGGLYTLIVTQDGTGGRTLTWNAVFKGQGGGTMPQPEGTIAAVTQFNFVSDGTNLYSLQCTPFVDTNYIVRGSADPTKKLRFEVDGFTTATTRVLTPPNFDGTIATLAGTETLSAKTLTNPTINAAVLSGVISGGTGTSIQADDSVTSAATTPLPVCFDGDTDTGFYRVAANVLGVVTAATNRFVFNADGDMWGVKTGTNFGTVGQELKSSGAIWATANAGAPLAVNRLSNDGDVIGIWQDTSQEGAITVSGTTVALSGGHLARFAQTDQSIDLMTRGTVVSSTGVKCSWHGEENEQLVKIKVSDIAGDPTVYGVIDFIDEDDEPRVASTGDFIIRVSGAIKNGDLLESAGDGTARAQADTVRRSSTIAKATVTDSVAGVRLLPCILLCG